MRGRSPCRRDHGLQEPKSRPGSRGLLMLERFGAKEPARSRPLTPRRLWRRGSCDGPRYEIFTLGSELGYSAVALRQQKIAICLPPVASAGDGLASPTFARVQAGARHGSGRSASRLLGTCRQPRQGPFFAARACFSAPFSLSSSRSLSLRVWCAAAIVHARAAAAIAWKRVPQSRCSAVRMQVSPPARPAPPP